MPLAHGADFLVFLTITAYSPSNRADLLVYLQLTAAHGPSSRVHLLVCLTHTAAHAPSTQGRPSGIFNTHSGTCP